MDLCDLNLADYNQSSWVVARTSRHYHPWLRVAEIWNIMHQIADGLAFIHKHGEVHRDLKPQNSSFPYDTYAKVKLCSSILKQGRIMEVI